jgi:hypothetical protein
MENKFVMNKVASKRRLENSNGDTWLLPKSDPQYDKMYQGNKKIENTDNFSSIKES